MEYKRFCSIIKREVKGIDVEDRSVSSFVRGAYESLPNGLNPDQEKAYAGAWAFGFLSGRLSANMRSRPLLTGLARRVAG